MQPVSSAITGALERVTQLASNGASSGKTGSQHLVAKSESETRAWLLKHEPEETDRLLLASLTSSLGVEVGLEKQFRFPKEGGYYATPVSANVRAGENIPAAIVRMEAALTPPLTEQVEDWLVLLQVACAGGRKSEITGEIALSFYTATLRRFPADVVKAVCQRMATKTRGGTAWFPTLAEMVEMCERLTATRLVAIAGLKRANEKGKTNDQPRPL